MIGGVKKVPAVGIFGRKNVGKSTLFNAILGKQRAITDSFPGLTRDILEAEVRRNDYHFNLCDLPGLDIESDDSIEKIILNKTWKHVENLDLGLLLFEPPAPAPFDYSLIDILRGKSLPMIYVLNKIDGREHELEVIPEFYRLGVSDIVAISALGRWNLQFLMRRIAAELPEINRLTLDSDSSGTGKIKRRRPHPVKQSTIISNFTKTDIDIAIVGKPNAGKSSLTNRLLKKDISLVSDIPGTTRDTVDAVFVYFGKQIRLVDTAGMRKTSYLRAKNRQVEFYSVSRAKRAITDCNVIIYLIDALIGITEFDKKVLNIVQNSNKAAIIAINKWDAVTGKHSKSQKEFLDRLYANFPRARFFPVSFCSALTGKRIFDLLESALELKKGMEIRMATSKMNSLIGSWNSRLSTGSKSPAKIYYVTQLTGPPPAFIFFVNKKKNFRESNISYYENRLREECFMPGIPIKIILKEK